MKKTILFLAIALITNLTTSAQFATAEYLDINNVRARYMVHGDMFWNPTTGSASYEFPKGSGKHSMAATSIWIGGLDQSTNQLKVAAQTDRINGNDYWPGPLDEFNGASIDSATSANWAQIWKINQTTIDSFNQISVHTISNTHKSILEWPGRNNIFSKTPSNTNLIVPDRQMAPFVDVNNDNKYNPLDGDYPYIKGEQMLFWVFNDKANQKTNSGSDPINIEIHGSAYACTKPGLENTTFVNLRVYNWSSSIMDSTFIGLWNDGDVGFAFDDYIGYDTAYKMAVYYNGDSFDETANGYGSQLTQTGIVMLGGPRIDNPNFPNPSPPHIVLPPSSFSYYNNTSNSQTGNPNNEAEYYNYLSGSWRDGTTIMAGCNPESTTGIPGSFVFADDPSVIGGTSEAACLKTPGDRKSILSSGPFQLYPGIVPSDITFAIINTNTGVDNSNFNELRRLADSAYQYVDGCNTPIAPLSIPNFRNSNLRVYPNPAAGFFIIEDEKSTDKKIMLYNAYGQLIIEEQSTIARTTINTSNLAKGLYFLRIESLGKQFAQSVLIK